MITIVEYGVGNIGSILNMLKYLGLPATASSDVGALAKAEKILLPGVGAFDHAMAAIDARGLRDVLTHKAMVERIPVLGICLGMQLMTKGSEEGSLPGLGWVDAQVRRFPASTTLKVPHMGWNTVTAAQPSPLVENMPPEPRFYFVHSYYVDLVNAGDRLLRTRYGIEFDSAFSVGNLYGAQFHPEKSHRFGMQFFRNFGAI